MLFRKFASCLVYPCSTFLHKEPTKMQLLDQLETLDTKREAKKTTYESQLKVLRQQIGDPKTPPVEVKKLRVKQKIILKKLAELDKQSEVSMGIQTRVIEVSNVSENVELLQMDSQITSTLIGEVQSTRSLIPGVDKMEENKAKLAEMQGDMEDLITSASLPLGSTGYSDVSLEEYSEAELDRLTNERLGIVSPPIVSSLEPLTRPSVYAIPSSTPPENPTRIKSS